MRLHKRVRGVVGGLLVLLWLSCPGWAQVDLLDFTDVLIEEVETGDPNARQDLPLDPAGSVFAVGVEGSLGDREDVDGYRFDLESGQQLDLRFAMDADSDHAVTAIAAGDREDFYMAAAGNLWSIRRSVNPEVRELLAGRKTIQDALGLNDPNLVINQLFYRQVDGEDLVFLAIEGRGDVLQVDEQGEVTVALTEQELLVQTGGTAAHLVGLSILEEPVQLESLASLAGNPIVRLEIVSDSFTGDIFIELFEDDAPITVANFLDYVRSGFYDGLIFHRAVSQPNPFVIQGGAYDPNLYNTFDPNFFTDPLWFRDPQFFHEPNPPIVNESSNQLRNNTGTVAMALSGTDPNSATSQFFINLANNNFLDFDQSTPPFTVFGRVVSGMETTVQDIVDLATLTIPSTAPIGITQLGDVPIDPVIIQRASEPNTLLTDFSVVVADGVSGQVFVATADFSELRLLADAQMIGEALQSELLEGDISSGRTPAPRTVVARTEEPFLINALTYIPADEAYPEGFYTSQLGPDFDGSGQVIRVDIDPDNPEDATFAPLFSPSLSQEQINPSALAFDTSGAFGGRLYMGSFGESLGDQMDGHVWEIAPNGTLTDFVGSYVDDQGQPVLRQGQQVDGFMDVTDMAFSPGGAWGAYLYVLSVNVDPNGIALGGFGSDIWRIDPSGVAELFVENVADGIGTLAFGPFSFGNDLYVGAFVDGGSVLRVSPDRSVEPFFDFGVFSGTQGVSDIIFPPADTVFGSVLLVSLDVGPENQLIQLNASNDLLEFPLVWVNDLQPGDLSGGDLVFDMNRQLVTAEGGRTQLTRLDYENLLDTTLLEVKIRDFEDGEQELPRSVIPYALIEIAEQFRIVRLGEISGEADIATEVSPSVLGASVADPETELTQEPLVLFDFSSDGSCVVYISSQESLRISPRNEDQAGFFNFSQELSRDQIGAGTDLQDIQILDLAISTLDPPSGDQDVVNEVLIAAGNGTQAEPGEDLPSQVFDDLVLRRELGTFLTPFIALRMTDLQAATLTLSGGTFEAQIPVFLGVEIQEVFPDLDSESYTLRIASDAGLVGTYDLLVALGGMLQQSDVVDEQSSPLQLTTLSGDRLELRMAGPGTATLIYTQRPGDGRLIKAQELVLDRTTLRTEVALLALDDREALTLDRVIIDGSVRTLQLHGRVERIDDVPGSRGRVMLGDWDQVIEVDTPLYQFDEVQVQTLGDPNLPGREFDAARIGRLLVLEDVHQITVLNSASRNRWQAIVVDGTVNNSTFFGGYLHLLEVNNLQDHDNAIDVGQFGMFGSPGTIREVLIEQGTVNSSAFIANKRIETFNVMNGNLAGSFVETTDVGGRIMQLQVHRLAAQSTESAGNIVDTRIRAPRLVNLVWAEGDMSGTTSIDNGQGDVRRRGSVINQIICQGDSSATVDGVKVGRILVGFDASGQRLQEDEEFTGSDFSGAISAFFGIHTLSVTGRIDGGTVQSSTGRITSIFAEDGLENVAVAAPQVTRIMVGYLGGRRSFIVNGEADVSGIINVNRLGRLYYTGELNESLEDDIRNNIRFKGPVVDDVP